MNERELAKALGDALEKALRNSSRLGSSVGGSSSHSNNDGAEVAGRRSNLGKVDRLDINLANKDFKTLSNTFKEVNKEMDRYRTQTQKTSLKFNQLMGAQNKLMESMIENENLSNDALDKLRIKLKETMSDYSFMGKGMKEYADSIQDLKEAFDETGDYMAGYNDILESSGESALKNINSTNKLKDALEKATKTLGLSDGVRAELTDAMRSSDMERMKSAAGLIDAENKNATGMRKALTKTILKYEKYNSILTNTTEMMSRFGDSVGLGFLKQMGTLIGSVGLLGIGLKGLYDGFNNIASAGYGTVGAYKTIMETSVKTGAAQESLVKAMQENTNTVTQMGLDRYASMLSDNMRPLKKLGLAPEEAAQAIAGFTENAKMAGINLQDTKAVDGAIDKQTKSFENLRKMTGMTADQYNSYNKQLLENSDVRKGLIRMNKSERVQASFNLMQMRDGFVQMGLMADQAQDMVATLKETQNMTVKDRFEQSAKLTQALSMMGMGKEAGEARQLMLKGPNRSTDEDKRFAAIMMKLGTKMESSYNKLDLAGQNVLDELKGSLGPQQLKMMEHGINAVVQGAKTSDKQVEDAKDKGRVSDTLVNVKSYIDSATEAITNPLALMVAGIGGLAFLATKQVSLLSVIALGSKKGILGGIGNMFKKGGNLLKGGARGVTGAIGGGASRVAGSVGGILSSTAGMGSKLLGAAKFLGPVAAGIGALTGAVSGVMNASEIFGTKTTTLGQKASAGLGGAISSLTFGYVSEESATKAIYKFSNSIGSFASDMWDGIVNSDFGKEVSKAYKESGVIGAIGAGVSEYYSMLGSAITSSVDFIFGEGSTDKLVETMSAVGKSMKNTLQKGWNAATGWVKDKTSWVSSWFSDDSSSSKVSSKPSVTGKESSISPKVSHPSKESKKKETKPNASTVPTNTETANTEVQSKEFNTPSFDEGTTMEQIVYLLSELLEVNKEQAGIAKDTERRVRVGGNQSTSNIVVHSTP